jgi:hypothetical protein
MFDPYRAMPSAAIDAGYGGVVVRWSIENACPHPMRFQGLGISDRKVLAGLEKSNICELPLSNLVFSTASVRIGNCDGTNGLAFLLVLDSDRDVRLSKPVEIWASPDTP